MAGRCKEKKAAASAAWAAANPERVKANKAAWRAANKEKHAAYNAAWAAANSEKRKASNAAWYAVNKDKVKASHAAWAAANKDKNRHHYLKRHYGITLDTYSVMIDAQGSVCKTCGQTCTSGKKLSVDHCHTTGKVRGLLCYSCNTSIGLVKENVQTLKNIITYIEEHNNEQTTTSTATLYSLRGQRQGACLHQ